MTTTVNGNSASQSLYLITSRDFPTEKPKELEANLSKSWVDLSQAVNTRTIGNYLLTSSASGNKFFSTVTTNAQQYRQSYRQVFTFGAIAAGATLNIAHGISGITQCIVMSGNCITAVPDFRPIPYASATVVTNQIEIRVNSTNITIINGVTAANITSGFVVLEYLLN